MTRLWSAIQRASRMNGGAMLLMAAASATASSLHSGGPHLLRRPHQPQDQSSLAIKALHGVRGGSTSGALKAIHRVRGGSTGGADWRFFVAGSISAALSHGYTTPIDVIKTRMQTNPELYNGSASLALRTIVASDGALFLLQGLGPTLIGYGTEGALKFGSYEMLKPLFASLTPSAFVNCILASCVAGAIAAVVLCPAEEVRTGMRMRMRVGTGMCICGPCPMPLSYVPCPIPCSCPCAVRAPCTIRVHAGAHPHGCRPELRLQLAGGARPNKQREGPVGLAGRLPCDGGQASALHDGQAGTATHESSSTQVPYTMGKQVLPHTNVVVHRSTCSHTWLYTRPAYVAVYSRSPSTSCARSPSTCSG